MKRFSESDKFAYDLNQNSVIMDVGAHCGNYSAIMHDRYGCTIHAYEPVPAFFNECVRRFKDKSAIRLWPFALGNSNRTDRFGVKGDMSGAFCVAANGTETVPVRDFVDVFRNLNLPMLDLLAINAEGAEFEILEEIAAADIAKQIRHISVQPHPVVPDYERRWAAIVEQLGRTHEHVYHEPWCWDGFSLRT